MSSQTERVRAVRAVASLAADLRRALYEYVAGSSHPVSRDEAAEATGVSRQVAAHHLDRLAEAGLLEVEFRRLTGRVGPGAGRPAKLYRRSDGVYDVSIPPRRYELAARLLLEAVGVGGVDSQVLSELAHRAGVEIGGSGLDEALGEVGYEPLVVEGETIFRNCPFQALRDQDRGLTCGLNLDLVKGMIEGAGSEATAVLAPTEGLCCVRVRAPATG